LIIEAVMLETIPNSRATQNELRRYTKCFVGSQTEQRTCRITNARENFNGFSESFRAISWETEDLCSFADKQTARKQANQLFDHLERKKRLA
jgi:hypothetical protein